MKTKLSVLLIALVTLFACSQQPKETADTIYTNGKIYTVNEAQPWAEAVAIKDGKFMKVGSIADVETLKGENTEVVDLEEKFVLPGFVDTHTHPFVDGNKAFGQLTLDNPKSLKDIQDQVLAFSEANPDLEWISGGMWPKGLFEGENAMREWLDEVLPDRPINLMDQGGHSYWCNTKALELAGMMDSDFVAPKFSIIERDNNGVPSGTIRETALGYMKRVMPKPTPELYAKTIDYVQKTFLKAGVTAHRAATGTEEGLKALKIAAEKDGISLHWAISMDVNYLESVYTFEECMQQIENRGKYASEFVQVDFAKLFVDGDLNGYGIKMVEPFEGTKDEYGKNSIEPKELTRLVTKFDQDSISVQFHAIGDQSIEYVVEALEAAAKENGGKLKTRHYPDHLGFITKDQIDRMVKVNGLIGFAPYFSMTFPGIHESYLQFVGKERLWRMQPIKTALDAGAIVGTGTDWNSLPQDPWPLLEGMVSRKNPWDANSETNNPDENITLEQALNVYTFGGAHALLMEKEIGSLEEGKYADFIVLDRNFFEIPIEDISETKVLKTIYSGKEVYSVK